MPLERVIVYGGTKSQTGKASREEYPELVIGDTKESFEEIKKELIGKPVLAMLPFWNSHGGEIKESHVAELIFRNGIKLYNLWPLRIIFECLTKGSDKEKIKTVISVFAAEPQCSTFLKALGIADDAFKGCKSTGEAFEIFESTEKFDAVLVPPAQYIKDGLKKIENDVSNKINFTTFVLLGKIQPEGWDGEAGNYLRTCCSPAASRIYGVEMPILGTSLSEDQQQLLVSLTEDIAKIDDIPSVIFVFEEEAEMCGILLESSKECTLSISSYDEIIPKDIIIRDDIGNTKQFYRKRIAELINREFIDFFRHDFIKHIGTSTCLYSCPPLNIFTHGYNPEVVEPVVRKMIDKYFELFVNGATCSEEQRIFFKKYEKNYYEKGSRFIEFVQV